MPNSNQAVHGLNYAGMAELVDAPDSKSGSGNRVGVRFPLPAPQGRILFKALLNRPSILRQLFSILDRLKTILHLCLALYATSCFPHAVCYLHRWLLI